MNTPYPSGLPIPLISGYSMTDGDRIAKDKFDEGYFDLSLISAHSGGMLAAQWSLSQLEFQAFEGYFYWELGSGSKSFLMPIRTAQGLQGVEFYFDGEYKASLNGKRWSVSAKLIMVEKPYDTRSDYFEAKVELLNYNILCGEAIAECGELEAQCGN